MSNLEEARARWRSIDSKTKKIRPMRTVLSGDGRGNAASNLYVSQDERFVYVREFGSEKFFIVKNSLGAAGPFVDLPLILGYDDRIDTGEEVVLSVNYEGIPDGTSGSTTFGMGKHSNQHQFRGGDEVYIDSRLFLPGDVVPTVPATMFLEVRSLTHNNNGQQRWVSGSTVDLTTYLPTGLSNVFLSISLDPSTNTLSYTEGVPFVTTSGSFTFDQFFNNASVIHSSGGFSDIPTPPLGNIPLAAVALNASTTRVDWASAIDNLTDMRVFLQPPPDAASVTGGNLSTGIPVFREKSGTTLNFRTFVGGSGVNISSATSVIQVHASGVMLQGSALLNSEASEGNALTWNSTASQWSAASISAGGGGGAGGSVNLGTGIEVLHEIAGGSTQMRTLIGGDNITISSSTSAVTIVGNLGATSVVFAPMGAHIFGDQTSEINTASTITLTNLKTLYDTHGFFNSASLQDRLTVPSGAEGIYTLNASVRFSTSSNTRRIVNIVNLNGGAVYGYNSVQATETGNTDINFTVVRELNTGDEVAIKTRQDSGTGLSLTSTNSSTVPALVIQKIAEHPDNSTLISQGAVGASLFQQAVLSVPNASFIYLENWTVGYDTHGFFNSASPDRMTIPEGLDGIYLISANSFWAANATGRRVMGVYQRNGGNIGVIEDRRQPAAVGTTNQPVVTFTTLFAGDELGVKIYQQSGGALDHLGTDSFNASNYPSFKLQKIAELPGLAPTRLLTGDNKGTGIEVYREKSGGSLQFRTITGDDLVSITSATSLITVAHGDHGARVYSDTNREVNTAVWTSLSMNQERWDTDAFHDTVTNNTRLTIPSNLAGKYLISAHIMFETNSSGMRLYRIIKNASIVLSRSSLRLDTNVGGAQSLTTVDDMSDGDYVEILVRQDNGVGLSVLAGNAVGSRDRCDFLLQKLS